MFDNMGGTPLMAAVLKLYQQAHIDDPSGGTTVDAEARTAINSILDLLENLGLMAAS